jgi:hypothetical protein
MGSATDLRLVTTLRQGRGPEAGSLPEYFEKAGHEAWNALRGLARRSAESVSDETIDTASLHRHLCPGAYFALLLDVAFKDRRRAPGLAKRFRDEMGSHPGAALGAAGYNLHEYHPLLDAAWLDVAREAYAHDPEGAWGILEAAAMYEPRLVLPEHLAFFAPRRADMPRDHYVVLFSLASHRPAEAPELLDRALRDFDEHPGDAVEAAAFCLRDERELQTEPLLRAVLRNFAARPEKAWEYFDGLSRTRPERFDDALLDALEPFAPGRLFDILQRHFERRPALVARYAALLRRHPKEGIDHARYAFGREHVRFLSADVVRAAVAGFEASAYSAYSFLRAAAEDRPELVGRREVDAALRAIPHATNYAFGFFAELLKTRPEFAVDSALALFECLSREPDHRAYLRAEELNSIAAVSEAAHVRTGLEQALRLPPRGGSRRGRALMAIVFREKRRARRHVLVEALRHAGGLVLHRNRTDDARWSPVWDFMMFLIEEAPGDGVSTAAAERFLEGAFQLRHLCRSGAEHEEFLRKLDVAFPPDAPFPAGLRFLEQVPGLARLHARVLELGRNFAEPPRLAPLGAFDGRAGALRRELDAVRASGPAARVRALEFRLACLTDPAYRAAFDDADAEARLAPEARRLLAAERRDLARRLRSALRSEAARIAGLGLERARLALVRGRVREILGRDVDPASIDPRLFPSFLWFSAVGRLPANREGLRRLIEDRISGRPHEWLWTEPAAADWAERVRAARPGLRLDLWRAPYEQSLRYRPADAAGEKRRRIKADRARARELLEKAGAKGLGSESAGELAAALAELRKPAEDRRAADPALLEEAAQDLERARIAEQTPESDYEGTVTFSVESDPFEILFMGEYGFASCLSLRGSNAWSAVSNAIDVDKTVVWAKDPGGNVVGRRLIALEPEGLAVFRTYTNRNGMALDAAFDAFLDGYARRLGTGIVRGLHPKPLLSDRWYDDGSL